MAFDQASNLDYQLSPATKIGSGPIPIDATSTSELFYEYLTNTAAGIETVNGINSPGNYNDKDVMFDLRIPAASRINFAKSYVRFEGMGVNMVAPTPPEPQTTTTTKVRAGPMPGLDPYSLLNNTVSIPWNTIAALLSTANYQLNQNSGLIEDISQNLGDGSMVKLLTTYSKDALEAAEDEFFTPCIETIRDMAAALSTQSISRSQNHFYSNDQIQKVAKNVPLCDIFESLKAPALWYSQNLQMKFHIKASNDILFKTSGSTIAYPRFYVTDVRLYLCLNNITENQMAVDSKAIASVAPIFREAYWVYDALQKTHSPGASYRDSNVKNMQAAVFMIPSSLAADGLGVNRYQYVYGKTNSTSGITSYQMRYENIYSPAQPIRMDNFQYMINTQLYNMYRTICMKGSDRDIPPAIPFRSCMGHFTHLAEDENNYVLFCSNFYSLTSYAHKVMAGADHEIITSGGTVEPIVIVRIRLAFLELRGDTSVYTYN